MKVDTGNLFDAIPETLTQELFTELAGGDGARIEKIVSTGQSSPASGWYDQELNEWVAVIKGEARIAFESGDEVHLEAGSYLNIPAHTKHRVVWTPENTETIWLAVHYK